MSFHLKNQTTRVGATSFTAVSLGESSSAYSRVCGLECDCYYVGEVVSVECSDGFNRIGQVISKDPENIVVAVGIGTEQKIPLCNVPEYLRKLLGSFVLDQVIVRTSFNPHDHIPTFTTGQSLLQPIKIGQPCSSSTCLQSNDRDHFYNEEIVGIFTANVGNIGVVTINREKEYSVNIGDRVYTFSASSRIAVDVRKLAGCFYVCDSSLPPRITLGCSIFSGLVLGYSCIAISRTCGFAAFSVGEVVAINAQGQSICGTVTAVARNKVTVQFGPESSQAMSIMGSQILDLCKLNGLFYVTESPSWMKLRFDFRTHVVSMGLTTRSPIPSEMIALNTPWHWWIGPVYAGEIVSVRHEHCRQLVSVWDPRDQQATILARTCQGGFLEISKFLVEKFCATFYYPENTPPIAQSTRSICKADVNATLEKFSTSRNGIVEISISHAQAVRRLVHTPENIAKQINEGLERDELISEENLRFAFSEHVGKGGKATIEGLQKALKKFGVVVDKSELEHFLALRGRGDKVIDFRDLQLAMENRWAVEAWVQSLPLVKLVSDALPQSADCHRLRVISSLTEQEIQDVGEGVGKAIERLLRQHVLELRQSFNAMDEQSREGGEGLSGVGQVGKFRHNIQGMHCGKIDDFYTAYTRVGSCDLDFFRGMRIEHFLGACRDVKFETSDFCVLTSPREEWRIVVEKEKPRKEAMVGGRQVVDYEKLLKLDVAINARLIKAEVISVVLYTGPMYHAYNTVLRESPKELLDKFKTTDNPNPFSTTILVLVSAVQKISRVTKLSPRLVLYRGLGGNVSLPTQFSRADEKDRRGFTEWGFMSTTTNKDFAFSYAGVEEKRPLPMVLEIRVGSVDRGACIREFSQYPQESEYLFVPGSFVEQDRVQYVEVTRSGVVTVIPVRVNMNLKTQTVEEREQQKKVAHVSAFRFLLEEIDAELRKLAEEKQAVIRLTEDKTRFAADNSTVQYSVDDFLKKIMAQCKEVCVRHEGIKPGEYAKEQVFQNLVLEMANIRQLARSKLEEWLENRTNSFIKFRMNASLKTVNRRRLVFLDKRLHDLTGKESVECAKVMCKLKGLIVDDPSEFIGDESDPARESALMRAAAEGRHVGDLRLLVKAGADVNATRNDGVSAIWLAAQFGHAHCVEELVELKADVNHQSSNLESPLYIASQSGYVGCVEVLVKHGADPSLADDFGWNAAHQAAMNGHADVLKKLWEVKANIQVHTKKGETALSIAAKHEKQDCVEFLSMVAGDVNTLTKQNNVKSTKPLILCTIDLSDMDGFYALAEYSRSCADVLMVLHVPSYVDAMESIGPVPAPGAPTSRSDKSALDEWNRDFGMGRDFFPTEEDRTGVLQDVAAFPGASLAEKGQRALTSAFFHMASECWKSFAATVGPPQGNLFFCLGEADAINPHPPDEVRRHLAVYRKFWKPLGPALSAAEGRVYDAAGQPCPDFALGHFERIHLGCTGSLAFFDSGWSQKLGDANLEAHVVSAVLAVGEDLVRQGLRDIPPPVDLNCLRCAARNQVYHPGHAAALLNLLQALKVPTHVVDAREPVDLLRAVEANGGQTVHTLEGVESFMEAKGLANSWMRELVRSFYASREDAVRRPCNFYAAAALRRELAGGGTAPVAGSERQLFYDGRYGLSLLATAGCGWAEAQEAYAAACNTAGAEDDTAARRREREHLTKEVKVLGQFSSMTSLPVRTLAGAEGRQPL